LTAAIRVTRALISALTGGRRAVGRPESLVQCSRKRRRSQRGTVYGVTITRDCLHLDQSQPDPEEAIGSAKLGPGRSLVHGELLAQGEVLLGELAVAAAEDREESKQVEQEGDHRTGTVSGSEPTDQPLARRTEFWRRTTAGPRGATPGERERGPLDSGRMVPASGTPPTVWRRIRRIGGSAPAFQFTMYGRGRSGSGVLARGCVTPGQRSILIVECRRSVRRPRDAARSSAEDASGFLWSCLSRVSNAMG
jgi:hypothetical protein